MNGKRISAAAFLLCCGLIILQSCSPGYIKPPEGERFYLAHNVWYETTDAFPSPVHGLMIDIPALNYKSGNMVPAGTIVDKVVVSGGSIRFFVPAHYITLTMKIHGRFQPGLKGEQLFERTITTKNFNKLTDGFDDNVKEAILKGILIEGMNKDEVLIAFGYPPLHKTPSLEAQTWMYWRNKWGRLKVEFNENGQTKADIIPGTTFTPDIR